MSTTRSQLYRLARDLGNVEAVEHGYTRGGLTGAAGGAAQREARRVIYRGEPGGQPVRTRHRSGPTALSSPGADVTEKLMSQRS